MPLSKKGSNSISQSSANFGGAMRLLALLPCTVSSLLDGLLVSILIKKWDKQFHVWSCGLLESLTSMDTGRSPVSMLSALD